MAHINRIDYFCAKCKNTGAFKGFIQASSFYEANKLAQDYGCIAETRAMRISDMRLDD